MSKGQRRGNREAKKPKKEKTGSAPASSVSAPWVTIEKMKAQDRTKK
jgi:hypothetical protein